MKEVRSALLVTLVGSIIFWIGMPFPVNMDFFDADTDAEQIIVVDENRVEIAVSFGLFGLGALIAGVGLWMLGRAIAPMEATRGSRWRMAALVASWLGVLSAIGGASRLLHALFATPEYMVEGGFDPVVGFVGMACTAMALVIFGVLAWSAPPPKWTAVVLIVGGVAGAGTFLPLFWYLALIIFAVANLWVTRRQTASPEPGPTVTS